MKLPCCAGKKMGRGFGPCTPPCGNAVVPGRSRLMRGCIGALEHLRGVCRGSPQMVMVRRASVRRCSRTWEGRPGIDRVLSGRAYGMGCALRVGPCLRL